MLFSAYQRGLDGLRGLGVIRIVGRGGAGESLGLVRLFLVITHRAEVTDRQLKAAYISRCV